MNLLTYSEGRWQHTVPYEFWYHFLQYRHTYILHLHMIEPIKLKDKKYF